MSFLLIQVLNKINKNFLIQYYSNQIHNKHQKHNFIHHLNKFLLYKNINLYNNIDLMV